MAALLSCEVGGLTIFMFEIWAPIGVWLSRSFLRPLVLQSFVLRFWRIKNMIGDVGIERLSVPGYFSLMLSSEPRCQGRPILFHGRSKWFCCLLASSLWCGWKFGIALAAGGFATEPSWLGSFLMSGWPSPPLELFLALGHGLLYPPYIAPSSYSAGNTCTQLYKCVYSTNLYNNVLTQSLRCLFSVLD